MISLITDMKPIKTFNYISPKNYLIYDFSKKFDDFYSKIYKIRTICVGDKLGYDKVNNEFYIDCESILQGFNRWYNNQSKEKSFFYLSQYIKNLCICISKTITYINSYILVKKREQEYDKILVKIQDINNIIRRVIEKLKQTYKDDDIFMNAFREIETNIIEYEKLIDVFFSLHKNVEYGDYVINTIETEKEKEIEDDATNEDSNK